jgi:AraC-like DNA-binding protein
MKVIPFSIPKTQKEAIRVQEDSMKHFYDNLHQHPEIQITLITRSEGVLIAGNYIGNFKENDVFVIGKNQPHVFRNDALYFNPENDLVAENISIFFDAQYFGDFFWNLDEMEIVRRFVAEAAGGLRIEGKTAQTIAVLLKDIVHKKGLDKLIAFFTILKVISESAEYKPLAAVEKYLNHNPKREPIGQYDSDRMNTILKYTFQEYQNTMTIEDVARVANLTPEAFCRYFKLRTRKTYWRFLYEVRINHACKLLTNKNMAVADVAYQSGFNNISNFNRVFKMIMDDTPRDYARKVTNLSFDK